MNRIINNILAIPFMLSRKIMGFYLKKNEDLYYSYQSNIAMYIFDNSVWKKESCNKIAKGIIKKTWS